MQQLRCIMLLSREMVEKASGPIIAVGAPCIHMSILVCKHTTGATSSLSIREVTFCTHFAPAPCMNYFRGTYARACACAPHCAASRATCATPKSYNEETETIACMHTDTHYVCTNGLHDVCDNMYAMTAYMLVCVCNVKKYIHVNIRMSLVSCDASL